jgi:L-threonylcarbamoyladenylate synthase
LILPANDESIRLAAEILARGELVGIPTETVYGLAANAWDPAAVGRIFAAKSRPPTNPLIVHVAGIDRLADAIFWPPSPSIRRQIDALSDLWPGPLTIVCPRGPRVPDEVTAGLPDVAVRVPAHDVALRLLAACEFPLAAPSANRSKYISPTLSVHVCDASGLAGHVSVVLDGGPCLHGVESTIVKLGDRPRLLRPGAVTVEQLAERLGVAPSDLQSAPGVTRGVPAATEAQPLLAPGMMAEHYAPATPLVLLRGTDAATGTQPADRAGQGRAGQDRGRGRGAAIGRISFCELSAEEAARYVIVETLSDRGDLAEVARHLFAALRRLDTAGLSAIHCDTCEPVGLGMAIMDRLRRAAARTESAGRPDE